MYALAYFLLIWLFGCKLLAQTTGEAAGWWLRLNRASNSGLCPDGTWFARASRLAGGLWLGVLITSWPLYLLAGLIHKIWPGQDLHPLTAANLFVSALILLYLIISTPHQAKKQKLRNPDTDSFSAGKLSGRLPYSTFSRNHKQYFLGNRLLRLSFNLEDSHRRQVLLLFFVPVLAITAAACWLMFYSFYAEGNYLAAGFSVFSDFAPHTAMASTFSQGRNWPTQYPHFAGDGIAYHFMFFFFCGNLNFLGLPLAMAVNLPSVLGMISALILLGSLAVVLTGRPAAFGLTMLLTLFRSSMAVFSYLGDLYRAYGFDFKIWLVNMKHESVFIGSTPRDDWGLWSVNVFANQRHLMPALALFFLILLLMLPLLSKGRGADLWLRRKSWLGSKLNKHEPLLVCLMMIMFPYWHGSVLIALLSVLAVMAVRSQGKLFYLLAAASAYVGSLLQTGFFAGGFDEAIRLSFLWGFLAEDKSLPGIFYYLFQIMGITFLLVFFLLIFERKGRHLILASLMPLTVAFTLSFTPDITVNHKFIMISIMLLNIWVADLLLKLINKLKGRFFVRTAAAVLLSVMLLMLTLTGLMEWHIFRNINSNAYKIELVNSVNNWIKRKTPVDSVFITAPYHYNSFFLTGRYIWFGHSYYAWSAGHDTGRRHQQIMWFLAGSENDVKAAYDFAEENGIDYLLADDTLRQHEQFKFNEAFFSDNFELAAEFSDQSNTRIYDLGKKVAKPAY